MKKSILISASIFTVLLLGAQIFAAPNPEREGLMWGQEHQFPPPRLSACYVIREETFTGTHGNGRDAP